MKFKVGDKVSFLSEKRDGIVKKVLNNKMVIVEIEEGFEIPVIESELVSSNPFNEKDISSSHNNSSNINEVDTIEDERFPDRFALIAPGNGEKKSRPGFYLAFIPENEEHMIEGNLAVYLINTSSFDALFTYHLKVNASYKNAAEWKYICTDLDRIDESTAVLLSHITRSDFESWEYLLFHIIFFKKGAETTQAPQSIELRIRPLRFYKEDNFVFFPEIGEKCFLFPFSDKEKQEPNEFAAREEWEDERWKNEKVQKPSGLKIVGHISNLQKPSVFPEKHLLEPGIGEVDLHIEELIEDISKQKDQNLMSIQMGYFTKMLDCAIASKLKKVIFIHGVGNGMLKQEIINKLKSNYPDLSYSDASMLRYGKGATEILISQPH